jgi:hypothetical protein
MRRPLCWCWLDQRRRRPRRAHGPGPREMEAPQLTNKGVATVGFLFSGKVDCAISHAREVRGTCRRANRLKLNSPCTAGKSCSARDLNQLSACLLVVCSVTTTVGEAYLVRTIGRPSVSQADFSVG